MMHTTQLGLSALISAFAVYWVMFLVLVDAEIEWDGWEPRWLRWLSWFTMPLWFPFAYLVGMGWLDRQ